MPYLMLELSASPNDITATATTTHREHAPLTVEDPLQAKKWNTHDGDAALALFENSDELHEPVSNEDEKKVLRKIDFMILPYLAVCYAFFYIDKHAKQDRGFFLMIQAACHNFATLGVLRTLAGAAESCSDPGFMLVTSMWYTRREQPVRIGLWYTANGFGIALGGLLGYGIGHIRGALPSWKYEFLIIGALCSAWGIVMILFLPDSPVTAKGLTLRERRIAVERLRVNQTGIENKHLKPYQIWEAFTDYKLYMFFFLGVVCNIPNGGISNFGTIIIQGFGFSTLVTTLMQIPYGVIIALSILLCVFLNDRFENKRCIFILVFLTPNITGAFGLRFVPLDQKVGRLICYYLTGPYNAAFVLVLSMQIANTAGSSPPSFFEY
uniref:Putative transporter n=1 Tax=Talaromyces marneffei PM1 TaxID=1077442 RepID=A0A093UZW9_TALMA